MKNTTKGVLATGAALMLLLGGGGTLALWTDAESIGGGAVNSGHLNIVTDGVNAGCGDWQIDSGELVALTYSPGDLLVPGDVLTRSCAFTIDAEGSHMRASVDITTPSFSGVDGDFAGTLDAVVTAVEVDGVSVPEITEADDGGTLTADIQVTFDDLAGNATQSLSTVLDALSLSVSQLHG